MRRDFRQALPALISLVLLLGSLFFAPAGMAAPPAQDNALLPYDEIVRGRISEGASQERWTFFGQNGDLILLDMRALDPNFLDTHLTLIDPQGNTLASNDDGGQGLNSRIGPITLPAAGDYQVIAGRYSGIGDYTLELKNLTTLPEIKPGKPLGGTVTASQTTEYFLLAPTNADALLKLTLTGDASGATPYMLLYGPTGLLGSTEFNDMNQIDPVIPLDNAPLVIAVNWNPSSPGGDYELRIEESDLELLQPGTSQGGTLSVAETTGKHYFRATADQQIRLRISVDGSIVPGMQVLSIDMTNYLFMTEGGAASEVSAVLTVPGDNVYSVEIWDASFSGETGSYTLSLDVIG